MNGRTSKLLGSVVVMRIIYAINWLNIGAVFQPMSAELGHGVTGLGAITASFFLGVGLLQVPGGILAARWGAKRVVLIGIVAYSGCALASALGQSLSYVALMRFGVGAGMAFCFAPTVVIVTSSIRGEDSGLGVGLLNSAFDVGGIFGLLWGVLAVAVGWRLSLGASGLLGLATFPLVLLLVPAAESAPKFQIRRSSLSKVLGDRRLILIGIGLLSLDCGNTIVGGFMVYYLQNLGMSALNAGAIADLIVVVPIFFALVGGRAYDRMKKPKQLLLLADLAMGAALLVCSAGGASAAIVGTTIGGVATGIGFTVGFAAARELNQGEREYDTLAVAWVNGISLFGSFFPPLLFSYIAANSGYSMGWLVGGTLTIAIALPVLLLKEGVPTRAASL